MYHIVTHQNSEFSLLQDLAFNNLQFFPQSGSQMRNYFPQHQWSREEKGEAVNFLESWKLIFTYYYIDLEITGRFIIMIIKVSCSTISPTSLIQLTSQCTWPIYAYSIPKFWISG